MTRRGWFLAVSLFAVLVPALFLLSTRRVPSSASPPAISPPPARPMVQIAPGRIEARHTVAVDIVQAGTIDGFFAEAGQNVIEGQLLARLTTTASAGANALDVARAKAAELRSAWEGAKLEALKAKADAQRARDGAAQSKKLFEREQKLSEIGATPRQAMESAQRESNGAQTESDKVEEVWRQADNRVAALGDLLRGSTAAMEAAAKQDASASAALAAAEIHAPVTGIVVERKGRIGQKTGPLEGKEIFRIAVELGKLRAIFPVSPGFLPGEDVLITIPDSQLPPVRAVIAGVEGANAFAEFESPSPAIVPGVRCSVSVQLK